MDQDDLADKKRWCGSSHVVIPSLDDGPLCHGRSGEDHLVVLDDELYRRVLRVHVEHLSLEAVIAHDGGGEDDREVSRAHLRHVNRPSRLRLQDRGGGRHEPDSPSPSERPAPDGRSGTRDNPDV